MAEKGLLTRTYSARDQVPDCPDFTRAKNNLPSWDEYFMPRHNMYKEDLALNNLQWLICHKTKPNHKYLI